MLPKMLNILKFIFFVVILTYNIMDPWYFWCIVYFTSILCLLYFFNIMCSTCILFVTYFLIEGRKLEDCKRLTSSSLNNVIVL